MKRRKNMKGTKGRGTNLGRDCSVLIDLGIYWILRTFFSVPIAKANLISVLSAFLFVIVLQQMVRKKTEKEKIIRIINGMKFLGMCMIPICLEIFCLQPLICIWEIWDIAAKILLQILVLFLLRVGMPHLQEKVVREGPQEEQGKRKLLIFAGFLLPGLTMLVAYIYNGIYPFGDRAVVIVDSLHQYLPFFTELHEKLVHTETLQYSFGSGFGFNMWAAFAYYLASPFNCLITLVSMEHVVDFMAYSILLKIAFSGGAFAWYLTGKEKRASYYVLPFSCMYALSAFMIGYYFNLMWLDSVMIVPFLMYGIEEIVNGKRGRFYGLVLAYGIYCNYYIGYMLCLFSVLYFLTLSAAKKRASWKQFFRNALRFGWFSLLAGTMAAVVLLPTVLNLRITESADNDFPSKLKFYVNELEQITGHFAGVEPITIYTNQSGVNIYCGVIILILILLYFLDREIRVAERVSKAGLFILLGLSMNLNVLNFIWHGFHVQNGLPNRFSFLYIALLLTMCYDALKHIRKQNTLRIAIAWIIPIILVAFCMVTECADREVYVYIITLVLLVIYGVFLLAIASFQTPKPILGELLIVTMTLEMMVSAFVGVGENGTVSRSSYVNDQLIYQELMKRTETESGFVRCEIDSKRMRNENMFMGANGIIMFSSTMPEATVDLCRSIGMEARTNKNGYVGVTKLFNDVFGIRYVLSRTDADSLYMMKQIDSEDYLHLYENEDALSLGFMVSTDLKEWDITEGEPMDVQRMFAALATGVPFHYTLRDSYSLEEGPTYIIRLHPGEQTYMQVTENIEKITIKTPQGEKSYDSYTKNLFDLGTVDTEGEDSKANVTLTFKEGRTEPVKVRIYTCSNEEYQEVYDKLAESQMTDIVESGNLVTGRIQAKEDGMLFLTVPFDDGWKVYVDGEERETYRVGEAFMGIDLEQGDHEIVMEFTAPGFREGTWLTILGLFLYLISCVVEQKKKRIREQSN